MYSRHHQHQNYVYDPNDGRPSNWLRICRECGSKTPGSAQFCRHCGMPTSRIRTEQYRNRQAFLALALILGVLVLANWLINDNILRMALVGVVMLASLILLIHTIRRRSR